MENVLEKQHVSARQDMLAQLVSIYVPQFMESPATGEDCVTYMEFVSAISDFVVPPAHWNAKEVRRVLAMDTVFVLATPLVTAGLNFA